MSTTVATSATATTTTEGIKAAAAGQGPNFEFCRALYSYNATDSSSLSFRRHDVIGVVNKLETGWWDGFLGDVRGWFPSNYVTIISEEEAEELLFGEQTSLVAQPSPSNRREIIGRSSTPGDSDDDWLHGDMDRSVSSTGSTQDMMEMLDSSPEINDYWSPEMMADGQVSTCSRLVGIILDCMVTDSVCEYPYWRKVSRFASGGRRSQREYRHVCFIILHIRQHLQLQHTT